MALASIIFFGLFFKGLFFGTLRTQEIEVIIDNLRFSIIESCLALTIFREELNVRLLSLFVSVIFFKIFHCLSSSR